MTFGRVVAVIPVVVAMLLGAGCGEAPRDGFEAFFTATQKKDADAAWDRLTIATRASLEETAGRRRMEAIGTAGQGKSMGAKDFLFGDEGGSGLKMTASLKSVDVIEQDDARALVEVTDISGQRSRVHMQREDGRWKLDLLAPAQAPR